ncbi:hypothetical protein T265_11118 [Opisthorchis viverrini]|uniref:Uncharacterized protein n=1 Tax=Opisthorchis viverrini TaxID=6198 RepID=A0A074ZAQ3_OPIVI|nr:hypothetical protein T265_11118 [Opisthorchis viverrini]KER20310.1 hypothetical protein T265_11118 [Opisthorchis viverrini]
MEGILDYLTTNELVPPIRHGILSNRSCLTNMLRFMDGVIWAKDEGLISIRHQTGKAPNEWLRKCAVLEKEKWLHVIQNYKSQRFSTNGEVLQKSSKADMRQ